MMKYIMHILSLSLSAYTNEITYIIENTHKPLHGELPEEDECTNTKLR